MERCSDRAVVLGTVDYGEADRLVTLLTLERGKLTAFAAGARKSKRRFAGALEPFTLLSVQLVERRGTTFRLDGATIERSFHRVREELPRIARALYALELSRELIRDHQPHQGLFELLVDYLEQLDERAAGPTSLLAFELEALAQAGLMPRFDRCALCGGAFDLGVRFDPSHGGAVCGRCGDRAREGMRVAPEVLRALNGLQAGERNPLPAELRSRGRELLNLFIAHQLGRRLKSEAFMAQVGTD